MTPEDIRTAIQEDATSRPWCLILRPLLMPIRLDAPSWGPSPRMYWQPGRRERYAGRNAGRVHHCGHPLRSIALATLDVLAGAADGIDFAVLANVASVQAWVTAG